MKFRPCIDLHNGKVKQIVGSSLSDSDNSAKENFVSKHDAKYYAELYKKDSLTGGHVIKLGPGNETEAVSALKAYPGGLQIGGGINDENASRYLDAGASHVIITSFVFKNGNINLENLKLLNNKIGKDKIVLDLSCRYKNDNYYVVTDRWQKFTKFEISQKNLEQLSSYCSEFLVHAADVEGKCDGIENEVLSLFSKFSPIPSTYAGGICSFDDIEKIKTIGKGKIDFTVGSALDIFGGNLSYKQIVKSF